jgi:hypothetical protein
MLVVSLIEHIVHYYVICHISRILVCVHNNLSCKSKLGISCNVVYNFAFGEMSLCRLSCFCRYSTWYISLLLAAGSVSKKKSDKGSPVTNCLMFHKSIILCHIRSTSSLTNSCCIDWCRFVITALFANFFRRWCVWN